MKRKVHEYEADGIAVRYDVARCIHAAECVRGLPRVFDPDRRPWIEPGERRSRPGGRDRTPLSDRRAHLRAPRRWRRGAGRRSRTPYGLSRTDRSTSRGRLRLHLPDGEVRDETRLALCRCGASGNKPLCDNSHLKSGFESGAGASRRGCARRRRRTRTAHSSCGSQRWAGAPLGPGDRRRRRRHLCRGRQGRAVPVRALGRQAVSATAPTTRATSRPSEGGAPTADQLKQQPEIVRGEARDRRPFAVEPPSRPGASSSAAARGSSPRPCRGRSSGRRRPAGSGRCGGRGRSPGPRRPGSHHGSRRKTYSAAVRLSPTPPALEADQEDVGRRVGLEALHRRRAVPCLTVEVGVRDVVLVEVLAHEGEQLGELREDDQLVPLVEDLAHLLEEALELGAPRLGPLLVDEPPDGTPPGAVGAAPRGPPSRSRRAPRSRPCRADSPGRRRAACRRARAARGVGRSRAPAPSSAAGRRAPRPWCVAG